ncbi:MAG: hypothetical protein EBV07_01720, partial [Proteobacteria bacterium]|nr:hypothetical protein [Pseudomonadota bacterium]
MRISKIENNQGQVLLIVIVAMAITLGVGLGITSRSTESLKRTGNLDSLQKVTAAAEGGLEKYLMKNDTQLEELATGTSALEPLDFSNGTTSIITINTLAAGINGMNYEKIKVSESVVFLTTEFSAASSTLGLVPANTCLNLTVVPANSSYMLTVITSNPTVNLNYAGVEYPSAVGAVPDPLNPAPPQDKTETNEFRQENYLVRAGSFDAPAPASCSFNGLQGISLTNSYMIRVQALSNEITSLTIKSNTPSVQKVIQGYKLVSKGQFKEDFSSDKTTRTIEAFK